MRGLQLCLIVLGIIVCGAASSYAAGSDAPPAPVIAFGTTKPLLTLSDRDEATRATVGIVLLNTGPASAEGVAVHLLTDDGTTRRLNDPVEATIDGAGTAFSGSIAAHSSVSLSLAFDLPVDLKVPTASLQVSATDVGPLSAELAVQRLVENATYWRTLLVSFLVAGVLTLLLASVAWGSATVHPGGWNQTIFTEKAWSFSDSWATNITAIGALLGTALGATGFLSEALPGVPVGRFTGLSMLFGAVVLVAPVVYIALGRRGEVEDKGGKAPLTWGTLTGLLLAGLLTLFAVAGELAVLWVLVTLSDASMRVQIFYAAALLLILSFVVLYAARSYRWLMRLPEPKTVASLETVSGAPGGRGASAAGAL